jgi:hypothetical protein
MSEEDLRALSEARGRQVTRPTSQTLDPGLVSEARGYYGDETYINELVANTGVGSGTLEQRQNALNTLIQQGKARNLAERGSEDAFLGASTNNGGGGDNNDEEEFVPMVGAKEILRNVLSSYGLEALYEYAWSLYANQTIDISDTESFMYALREQEAYKKRFAANERRKALGFNELKPATYIALEKSYKDTLAANGLPQGFYDSPDDFEKLIGGDVSVAELNNRLKDAYTVVRDASPEVKNKMAEMYGITDGDLLAYVIDPDRARPLMAPDYKRQAQAALIAESAQRLSALSFNKDIAEQFVRQGITQAEAEAAFTTVGQMGELRRGGFGEQQITDLQFAQAALGTDAEAKRLVEERKKRRIGEVTASGGSATLAQGDSTSYKSGYGQANL